MKYNPLHPHCGPFNSIDKFPPKDKVDRACWQHDRGYAKLGPQAYIKYNKFDEQFVHRLSKLNGTAAKIYAAPFKAKKFLFPKLNMSSSNGNSRGRSLTRRPPPTPNKSPPAARNRSMSSSRSMSSARSTAPSWSTASFRSGRSSRSGQSSAAAGGRYGVTRKSFGRKVKAGDLFPAGLDKAFGQFQRYGALSTNETGISSTLGVTDACFLGHASFRYEQLMTMFWQALIKSLFAECNINIYNWSEVAAINIGDILRVFGKVNLAAGTAQSNFGYVCVGGETYFQLATALESAYNAWKQKDNQSVLNLVQFTTGTSIPVYARLDLTGATVSFLTQSTLKLQNQTASAGGDEDDEVDRIPLSVTQYAGNGTGVISNRTVATEEQIVVDRTTGVIKKVGSVASGTAEAPPKSYFTTCKFIKKTTMTPGQIFTSNLVYRKKVSLVDFVNTMQAASGLATAANTYNPYGKYQLYHFEHVLKPKATTSSIIVNGEVNFKCGLSLWLRKYHATDEHVYTPSYVTY